MGRVRGDSIYSGCLDAIDILRQRATPFSQIDVVARASRESDWEPRQIVEAERRANQALTTLYQRARLCRFGPVTFADGTADYLRKRGVIMYIGLDANRDPLLPSIDTPNGTFSVVRPWEVPESLRRPGRKRTIRNHRDDFEPWASQALDAEGIIV